jgi:hypothetical protein
LEREEELLKYQPLCSDSFHFFFCVSADDSTGLVGLAELSVALLKRCSQPSTSAIASDTKLILAAIAEAYRQYVGQRLLALLQNATPSEALEFLVKACMKVPSTDVPFPCRFHY